MVNFQNAWFFGFGPSNPVSIIGTEGTVYVEGTSEYSVTVNTYGESADMSGASVIIDWNEFERDSD